MKHLSLAAVMLSLAAVPAQAQLLGGSGGLGGVVGGTIGGTVGGPIMGGGLGDLSRTTDGLRSTTRGTLDARGSTSGSKKVDTRSGRVDASRSGNASVTSGIGQVVSNPIAPVGADASGSGSASGQGNASAQLIGTDAVRGVAASGVSTVGGAVSSGKSAAAGAAGQAQGAVGGAAGLAGSAAGSLAGSASGSGSASGGGSATGNGSAAGTGSVTGAADGMLSGLNLAAAGSSAAQGEGAFAVQPGMDVLGAGGQKIGEVRQVVADSRGQVSEVIVAQGNRQAPIPAADLQGSGSVLYAAQGSGQVN